MELFFCVPITDGRFKTLGISTARGSEWRTLAWQGEHELQAVPLPLAHNSTLGSW